MAALAGATGRSIRPKHTKSNVSKGSNSEVDCNLKAAVPTAGKVADTEIAEANSDPVKPLPTSHEFPRSSPLASYSLSVRVTEFTSRWTSRREPQISG